MFSSEKDLMELFQIDYYAEEVYRKYHIAKNSGGLKEFFNTLDVQKVRENNMWMYELFGALPSICLGFPEIEKKNIHIVKHASYLPLFTHCHDYFEIVYVYSGGCDNVINGNKIHMKHGDICIMAPGSYHSLGVFDQSIVINILLKKDAVQSEFMEPFSEKNCLSQFFLCNLYDTPICEYFLIPAVEDSNLRFMIQQLIFEGLQCNTAFSEYSYKIQDSLFSAVLYSIMRYYKVTLLRQINSQHHTSLTYQIISYIYQHYQNVSLEQLAQHFNYATAYMSNLVKNLTGRNFLTLLQEARLKKACSLLQSTDWPVHKVSEYVGYSHLDSFYKAFKIFTGYTPNAYRGMP